MADNATNPAHYDLPGGLEVFDVILATQGIDATKGFCEGNIIKYMLRAKKKGGAEDHKKASWYLSWLIDLEEAANENKN